MSALSSNAPFLDNFIIADFGEIIKKNISGALSNVTVVLERAYYPLIIHMLHLQEHLLFVGSSGFGSMYFTDLSQMRVSSSGMSVNVSLYPIFPLKF